jgi:DNA-directed RNA polymerase specialized sigma24 family protein
MGPIVREESVSMGEQRSVTFLIGQLKAGDGNAVQKLWERYYARLVGLARLKLRGARRRVADEEDVALSAFDSFCRGAERNRFPRLGDRDDLWQLLMMVTIRKAIDLRQHEARKKRGGGAFPVAQDESSILDQVEGREPTPEFAAQVAEECQRLLKRIDDPELRQIAVWKMEGYTNEEVAARLNCVVRTVERKLKLLRALLWSQADEP